MTHSADQSRQALADAVDDLIDRYLELSGRTGRRYRHASGAGMHLDLPKRGGATGPQIPIDQAAVMVMIDIEQTASALWRVCSVDARPPRAGMSRAAVTLWRLVSLRDYIVEMHAPAVAAQLWRVYRHTDLQPRAFPIDGEYCPQCQAQSLWADPASGAVACGMPGCGYQFTTHKEGRPPHGDG